MALAELWLGTDDVLSHSQLAAASERIAVLEARNTQLSKDNARLQAQVVCQEHSRGFT